MLLLIDLGRGQNRLGGSILAQVVSQTGAAPPDVDSPADLKNFWNAIQQLGREKRLLAYHDRSDGGLLATVVEMCFAGHTGADLELSPALHSHLTSPISHFAQLFSEELGAVVQIRTADFDHVSGVFESCGLPSAVSRLGTLNPTHTFRVTQAGQVLYEENLFNLRAIWSDVTRRIQTMRDNPKCAEEEHQLKMDPTDPGISPRITFAYPGFVARRDAETAEIGGTEGLGFEPTAVSATLRATPPKSRPPIAILREQGVNGEVEMAAAFTRAGFKAIDVHMTDILSGRISLKNFRGLAACGGFSYGDVLGAGEGWAKSILFHDRARAEFADFFAREDTFALGVCNGCQMMSNLKSIIPGAEHWPRFVQNQSERYEARFVSVRIEKSPSVLFAGMEGSVIPIATAHGEGFAEFVHGEAARNCSESGLVVARFVNHRHEVTEQYPLNPNGSPFGLTALTTTTGRVTILMPHPERVHLTACMSWAPADWPEESPWMRLFENARSWVE